MNIALPEKVHFSDLFSLDNGIGESRRKVLFFLEMSNFLLRGLVTWMKGKKGVDSLIFTPLLISIWMRGRKTPLFLIQTLGLSSFLCHCAPFIIKFRGKQIYCQRLKSLFSLSLSLQDTLFHPSTMAKELCSKLSLKYIRQWKADEVSKYITACPRSLNR